MKRNSKPELFTSLHGVQQYLDSLGWKVSRSGIYKHQREGKLRPRDDGTYNLKDVDKYATTFLKRKDGSSTTDDLDRKQGEKLDAEIKKVRAQADHWELKTKIAQGLYIEKALFEHELAARASQYKTDLINLAHTKAEAIVKRIVGNMLYEAIIVPVKEARELSSSEGERKIIDVALEAAEQSYQATTDQIIPELIDFMIREFDQILDRYAKDRQFIIQYYSAGVSEEDDVNEMSDETE